MFVRTAYLPQAWPLTFSVFHADTMTPKDCDALLAQDIAGPLCFSGDFLARDVHLPPLAVGDWLVVHDTGAYTTSMYSRYNSIPAPAVYGFSRARPHQLELLRAQESVDATLALWGACGPGQAPASSFLL